ncbi:MAG: transporter [Nitrospiraceae bacterium]
MIHSHSVARVFVLSCLSALIFIPSVTRSQDERWQVGVSPTYTAGNFGTTTPTTSLYVPLTVRRLFANGDVALVIPYVSVTSNGSVTLVGGVPNRTSITGLSGIAGSSRDKTPGNVLPAATNEDGLGDIILRGRYSVVEERNFLPLITLMARLKIPTADEKRGLGTGEFDKGFGVELTKQLTENVVSFADVGYTFIGKPDQVALRNQWNYDLGLGYYFTRKLLGSVHYEEYRALLQGLNNPRDVLVAMNYKATSAFRMNASVLMGLSSGAPDYGLTGGLSYRF